MTATCPHCGGSVIWPFYCVGVAVPKKVSPPNTRDYRGFRGPYRLVQAHELWTPGPRGFAPREAV